MQKLFIALVVAAALGLVTVAAEKPPANYQQAMKDLGAFSAGNDKAVMEEDYETTARLGRSAKEAFDVTETFWKTRNPDAAKMAQTGSKAATDLMITSGVKSQEGVAFAAMEAKAVCAGCHMAHRERLPDGTFEIK